MTKLRSLLTAALFALVTANAYVLLSQTASAESASADSSACGHNVKTTDFDTITPEEYNRLYSN